MYKELIENLGYCLGEISGCGLCEKSEEGCHRSKLIEQSILAIINLMERNNRKFYL